MNEFLIFLKNNIGLLKSFTPHLIKSKKNKVFLQLSIIFVIVCLSLSAYIPYLFGQLVEKASSNEEYLLLPFLFYVILWASNSLLTHLRAILGWYPLRAGMHSFLKDLFQKVINQPKYLFNKTKIGKITTIFNKAEFSLNTYFWHTYYYIIPLILEIVLICGFIYLSVGLFYMLNLLFGILTFITATILLSKNDNQFLKENNEALNNLSSKITDKLLNVEIIRHFNRAEYETEIINDLLYKKRKKSLKLDIHFEKVFLLQNLILSFVLFLFIISSYIDYYNGNVELSVLIMLNTYVVRITTPMSYLGYVIREIKYSSTHIQEILKIFTLVEEKTKFNVPTISNFDIEFKNVNLTVHKNNILRNINLKIPSNTSIAFVGSSGSGKTSLINLLLEKTHGYLGEIKIGGKNIKSISYNYLNSIISIATQDSKMFNETIKYNLTYGCKNELDTKHIDNAIHEVNLQEKIEELEYGVDTKILELSNNLSGGERQRLGIARALLKPAKIYLFDEISASLDVYNSQLIYKNILSNLKGNTLIFSSHEEYIANLCDKVCFLKNGRIIMTGTHQQLLKNKEYKNFWAYQNKPT